ncbi:DUF4012 domain-containing protein [Candidatus Gottesmanbacteria bacterium]|nr:DUF4012 domain-containing protein [Candidatus Gottesmanbacteria bacterium]
MKSSRKIIFSQEENQRVKVGIIGEGRIAESLKEKLIGQNCQVISTALFSGELSNCSYIFQLDDFASIPKINKLAVQKNIKLLVVLPEAGVDLEELKKSELAKILIIGEERRWEGEKLIGTILWAMFSKSAGKLINFSRQKVEVKTRVKPKRKISFKFRIPSQTKYLVIGLLILSPAILTILNLWQAGLNLKNFEKYMVGGRWNEAKEVIGGARRNMRLNDMVFSLVAGVTPFGGGMINSWESLGVVMEKSISVGEGILEAKEIVSREKEMFGSGDAAMDPAAIERLNRILSQINGDTASIEREIPKVEIPFFPKEEMLEKIRSNKEKLELVNNLLPIVSRVIKDEKAYKLLVLFQNNTELRPTGGFIGSYGLVNIKEGRIASFKIYDVYGADGQLRAHVDPPLAIREYMSQPNWFLRDSNFDPDFSVSGQQAEWFLEKETGERVDGVIGVNLTLLREILRSLGPIYLPDYKENITADNLFIKATVYVQKGFFPGSSAKGDFLGSLANALYFSLGSLNFNQWYGLGGAIGAGLEEKNILLFFHDEELQAMVEERGWGGRMLDINCPIENCFADYIAINEANLGVNKANMYIVRKVEVVKNFAAGGGIDSIISINYRNDSPMEVFPAGTYKNYLRFFLPREAVVSSIKYDGREIERIDRNDYGKDKTEVGVWVEIPPLASKQVVIEYTLPAITGNKFSYQLFYQKQAGERDTETDLQFGFPTNWKVRSRNFSAKREGDGYKYNTDALVDRVFIWDVDN